MSRPQIKRFFTFPIRGLKENTMRTLTLFTLTAAIFLMLTLPAMANPRQDYIEERLDAWITYAEDLDYDIIETEVDTISNDETMYFYLEPGTYHLYAEGGSNIEDLDMEVLDDRGRELGSDFLADNYPVVDFSIRDRQEIEINLSVYEFSHRDNSGYFCFVLARESNYRDRGRDRWRDDDRGGYGRGDRRHNRDRWDDDNYWSDDYNDDWYDDGRGDRYDWYGWRNDYRDWDWHYGYNYDWGRDWDNYSSGNERRSIVEESLQDLYDFAYYRGHDPIMDDIDQISDTETYSLTLDRGYYVAFAAGGRNIDDLDLKINDRDGWNIAQDIDPDANPAVWFYLPERETVEIEVEVWSFRDWNDSGYFALLVCER